MLNAVICGTTFVKWGKKRKISLNRVKAVKRLKLRGKKWNSLK